jgi:hypothetical protein
MNNENNGQIDNSSGLTYNIFDVEDPVQEDRGGYDIFNVEPSREGDERLARIEASKNKALERLNPGASLDDSFTDMGNGWLESNKNKIWNDLSDQEVQSLYHEVMNRELTVGPDGRKYFKDGTEYKGSTRRAYMGGTKDGTNEVVKFGLARSDKENSAARYDPEQGGWVSGESGIDAANMEKDVLLPYGEATMLESVLHGRKKALEGRVVKDMFANPDTKAAYGGGASEYYKSKEALFGKPTEVDTTLGAKLFDEYMSKLPRSHREFRPYKGGLEYLLGDYDDIDRNSPELRSMADAVNKYQKEQGITLNRVFNEALQTVSALPAGIAKGAIELADAAQEALTFLPQLAVRMSTGDRNYDIDLFDDGLKESIIEHVDDLTGYDRAKDNAVIEEAHSQIKAAGIDVTSLDSIVEGFSDPKKRALLGDAALSILADPSLTMGMITEVFGSGLGLGAATKVGAKAAPKLFKAFESNSNKIKEAVKKASEAGDTAALKALENSYTLGKKTSDLLRGSVFTNADMAVRMNNDITAFKENNNGETPDNAKLFEMAVLNRIVSSGEIISLKSLLGIKNAPAEVVKEAVKSGVLKATGKVVGKTLKGGVTEGVQETVDSVVEQLNQKLDSADWEGKSVSDILSEASADILTGTIAGAASGVQLSGVSSTFKESVKGLKTKLGTAYEDVDSPESETAENEIQNVINQHKTYASDSSNESSSANFYASHASGEEDAKNKAKEFAENTRLALLDGSHTVFSSDKESAPNEVAKAVEIAVANNPDVDYEVMKSAITESLGKMDIVVNDAIITKLDSAYNAGKAFAAVKSMESVSKEVSTGVNGFVTYYTAAKAAEHAGDTETQEKYISRLAAFYHYEDVKLSRIKSKLADVEGAVLAEAELLVQTGEAKSIDEALKKKGEEYKKHKSAYTEVTNSEKPNAPKTKISHYDVALRLRTLKSNRPYDRGIYRYVDTVASEVGAMKTAHNALLGIDDSDVVISTQNAAEQSSDSAEYVVPKKIMSFIAANPDNPYTIRIVNALDAAGSLTQEQEAKILNSIARYEEKLAKTANEDTTQLPTMPAEGDLDALEPLEPLNPLNDTTEETYTEDVTTFESTGDLSQFENLEAFSDGDTSFSAEPHVDEELTEFDISLSNYDDTFVDTSDLPQEVFDSVIEESLKPLHHDGYGTLSGNKVEHVKVDEAAKLEESKNKLLEVKNAIRERKNTLRNEGAEPDLVAQDSELEALYKKKDEIQAKLDGMDNFLVNHIGRKVGALKDWAEKVLVTLFSNYEGGVAKPVGFKVADIFKVKSITGFTVRKETADTVENSTVDYGDRLTSVVPKPNHNVASGIESNIAGFLLYDIDGSVNYNVVQAMHVAVNDFVLRNSENLFGAGRSLEDIAEILGVDATSVTAEDLMALMNGGVTLKLAASEVGKSVIKHLGLKPTTISAENALATHLGIAALQGYSDQKGQGISNEVLTRSYPGSGKVDIRLVKGNELLLDRLKEMRETNEAVEGRLSVTVNNTKTYRTEKKNKPRVVKLRNAEELDAPKEHTELVNKLENTPFNFNSGNDVLFSLFSVDGVLDKELLMDTIIGPKDAERNKDDSDSYKAQRLALKRDLDTYLKAISDTGSSDIFFDWFIARNHRIYLDGVEINPQTDKQLARWLLTPRGSKAEVNKDILYEVINGEHAGDYSHDVMVAKTFAYAIVQAFDGISIFPGIDKDNEQDVLKAAKKLLDGDISKDELVAFVKSGDVDHIGHAASAIANIDKFNESSNSATFVSDIVLEVDGLTNGFAFRAMQYPVGKPDEVKAWLEKVGVIDTENSSVGSDGSPLSDLESMNSARKAGQDDVYIHTGKVLGKNVAGAKKSLEKDAKSGSKDSEDSENSISWIKLFEGSGNLPDFSADMKGESESSKSLLKFVRNLMKSPVMIFGYAAGIKSITEGLVLDQVIGKNYLKGKGLIAALTEKNSEGFAITEKSLIATFGKDRGKRYHKARTALASKSILDNSNADIILLREDLKRTVESLYGKPLKDTLNSLFGPQIAVNSSLVLAGEFLFSYFEKMYNRHIAENPNIDENGKTQWLRENASIIPGIAGASSTNKNTKLMFLKNVLDKTNDYVSVNINGKKLATNTVARGYGKPGVGPAVLTILSLDSTNMAEAINAFYKGEDHANVVPVHDAEVFGVADYGNTKQYSKTFYEVNKRYSVVEEFGKAIDFMARSVGESIEGFTVQTMTGPVTFAEMRNDLESTIKQVMVGREELYNKKLKVMQMVMAEGTGHLADPVNDKEKAIKYIKDFAITVSNRINSKEFRDTLGVEYKYHVKAINKMLKGCK